MIMTIVGVDNDGCYKDNDQNFQSTIKCLLVAIAIMKHFEF